MINIRATQNYDLDYDQPTLLHPKQPYLYAISGLDEELRDKVMSTDFFVNFYIDGQTNHRLVTTNEIFIQPAAVPIFLDKFKEVYITHQANPKSLVKYQDFYDTLMDFHVQFVNAYTKHKTRQVKFHAYLNAIWMSVIVFVWMILVGNYFNGYFALSVNNILMQMVFSMVMALGIGLIILYLFDRYSLFLMLFIWFLCFNFVGILCVTFSKHNALFNFLNIAILIGMVVVMVVLGRWFDRSRLVISFKSFWKLAYRKILSVFCEPDYVLNDHNEVKLKNK